mmetsp:Transcript_8747/g.16101  ORF Transcript_8747/g.16101 Transcript_8747/m.16101 type:complete len:1021 (-) Transcript_8747:260-3322(-)
MVSGNTTQALKEQLLTHSVHFQLPAQAIGGDSRRSSKASAAPDGPRQGPRPTRDNSRGQSIDMRDDRVRSESAGRCREVGPGGYSERSPTRRRGAKSPGPSSPWRGDNPWLNSSRPRHRPTVFVPFGGAAGEALTFPHAPDCAHCAQLLLPAEMRWGTGLCDACYEQVDKTCKSCRNELHAQELRWNSGLCNTCYDVCEKRCQFCTNWLEFRQMHWRTGLCDSCYDGAEKTCQLCQGWLQHDQLHWASGLCDGCYDSCDKKCRICKVKLKRGILRWGTGLCDGCYDSCQKTCRICSELLDKDQLHYQSGLCDGCYDTSEKSCKMCSGNLRLGELHWHSGLCDGCYDNSNKFCTMCTTSLQLEELQWDSGLCDPCYDKCEKTCKKCEAFLVVDEMKWNSGLCNLCYNRADKTCVICKGKIETGQLHWDSGFCDTCYDDQQKDCSLCNARLQFGDLRYGTGLCDMCYDEVEKSCRMCNIKLQFRSLRWGTGMCDICYNKCDKNCGMCGTNLTLGNLRYGTGICDPCYDSTEKQCRHCNTILAVGDRRYATGLCNECYDKSKKAARQKMQDHDGGLEPCVWAAILAQLVFYMAPALLQPCLFLQISATSINADAAPSIYAMVLTCASVAGMTAPVPLGLWAEAKGEREVYVGSTIIAAVSGVAISFVSFPPAFAGAWGVLNMPPAIRGVRAVFFSKHVPPEELSRAGQLASAAGLLGSVVGPIVSTCIQKVFRSLGWTVNGILATSSHVACALYMLAKMPAPVERRKKELARGDSTRGCFGGCCPSRTTVSSSGDEETQGLCEACNASLNEEERRYRSALCNVCYDSYGGVGFKRFKWRVLMSFCAVAGLLELSLNASILGTFQPIAIRKLGWGSTEIAAMNFASALLSVIVSLVSAQLRLEEGFQVSVAAGMYCASGIFFTCPPLATWKMLVGLVLGLKAQILFMAPFTSIFSRLIGRTRVTNRLTIALCLAPAIGGVVGTMLAPIFFRFTVDTWLFPLSTLPACASFAAIVMRVKRLDGSL